MFAERGLRATTVRDIADGAGILSGSLYHHFSSKEEMVDELLRSFLDWLFARYREIVDSEANPLERLKGLFMASFEAIEHRHAQVVIYQDEAQRLLSQPRFSYIEDMNRQQRKMWVEALHQGIDEGYFQPDLDVDLVYRFIRDTTWVSVRWYQPGGAAHRGAGGSAISRHRSWRHYQRRSLNMPEAYVIDAVRTAVGKRGGALAGVHPVDLGALGWRGLLDRVDVDPAAVDDVIAGCVDAIGAQAGNIARLSWLAAGYPEEVPGVTVDRQCGSSQQAISFGAQAILAGTADLIVAGGVQNMSQIPISSAMTVGEQFGFTSPTNESKQWLHRYGDQEISQFRGSELIAEKWNLSREEMERYALTSHERAFAAIRGGHFDNEIITVETESGPFRVDEGPRESSLEKMAGLKTLVEGGKLTAAMASQISDGASAVLLASEQAVKDHKLTPRARIHHISARAADPVFMLTGPIPATRYALEKTGLSIEDIDTVEINEAFAPVVLAWLKEIKADPEKVNPNGGAIALGHPLGATGAKLFTTMLNELERIGGRYGLQTMCEGGGTANVTIIERL